MGNKSFTQYLLLIIIFISSNLFSQTKNINLIILNDRNISKSVFNFKITPLNYNSLEESVSGSYIPGNLVLESKDFDKLMNSNFENFEISFTQILTVNPDLVKELKYKVKIPKYYLNYEYLIVNIFNMYDKTSKKKYNKLIKNNKEYYIVVENPNSMKFD